MTQPLEKNEHSKALALIMCLFLAYMYKALIWDPYFGGTGMPQGAANAPVAQTGNAVSNAKNDPYAEPIAALPQTVKTNPQAVSGGSTEQVNSAPQATQQKAAQSDSLSYPSDDEINEMGWVVVEGDKIRAKVSLLGGRLMELRLKEYASTLEPGAQPLNLVEHADKAPLPLGLYSGPRSDAWTSYRLISGQTVSREGEKETVLPLTSGEDLTLVFEAPMSDGRVVTKKLTFHNNDYFIDVHVQVNQQAADNAGFSLEWTSLLTKDSPALLDPYKTSGYVWFDGQSAQREPFASLKTDQEEFGSLVWVSLADKYFMASIVSPEDPKLSPAIGKVLRTADLYRIRLTTPLLSKEFKVFAGPKKLNLLEASGFELKRNIDLGRTAVISTPLLSLLHLLHGFLGNYGLAIIMLTILVKLALYPLTASSFKQMKAMQDLAPEIKKLRESGKDKNQIQLETMQLYKNRGVNPLGGCLPILLQMPVFIGLYSTLSLDIELRHAPFALWILDLSAPEKLMIAGAGIPIMVILFVISMLVQQWTTPSTVDPAQKRAMLIVPLIFGFMFAKMPAGLTLYWLTNNLISIGQQSGFRKNSASSALKVTLAVAIGLFAFAFALTRIH